MPKLDRRRKIGSPDHHRRFLLRPARVRETASAPESTSELPYVSSTKDLTPKQLTLNGLTNYLS